MKIVMIRAKKATMLFGMVVFFTGHTALPFRRPTFTVPTKDAVLHAFDVVQEKVQPVISTIQEKAKQVATDTNVAIPFYSTAQKLAADKAPNIVVKTAINGVFDQLIPAAISESLPSVYTKQQVEERDRGLLAQANIAQTQNIARVRAENTNENCAIKLNAELEAIETMFNPDTKFEYTNSSCKVLNISLSGELKVDADRLKTAVITFFRGRDLQQPVHVPAETQMNFSSVPFLPNTTKVDTDYSHLNAVRALHAVLFAEDGIATIPGFVLLKSKLPKFLYNEQGLVPSFMPALAPVLKHASAYLLLSSGKTSLSDYAKGLATVSSAISSIHSIPGLTKTTAKVPLVGNALPSFIGKTVGVSLMVAAGNKENSVSLRAANQGIMTLLQLKHLVSAVKKIATKPSSSGFVSRGIQNAPDAVLAGIALYNSSNVLRDLWKEHKEAQKNKNEIVVK